MSAHRDSGEAHAGEARGPAAHATSEALLAAPPLRAVVQLAAPTTLVMLISALSNVLYTYYVSRIGADAIAAVSLVFPLALVATTAMGGGLGAGASSALARALGARRRGEAARIAEQALLLAAGLGIAFGAVMVLWGEAIFRLMGGRDAVLDAATHFARVLFGGATITFIGAMLDSILRGEGNARTPALWSSTSLALQIALTPLFMFVFHLGLIGAALSMLASQLIATVARSRHILGERGLLRDAAWPPSFDRASLREILRVGIPASLSTLLSNLGIMVLTGVLARLGTAHLAAYGLGTRLDFLFLSLAYGFGIAVTTLVGLATGARRPELVRTYVLRAGLLIVALLALPAAGLFFWPTAWLGMFTHDPEIVAVGTQYLRIIGPSYPLVGISMLVAFAFQGLGRATTPLVWMAIRVALVLAAALVCTQVLGLADRAVFAAVAIGNALSAVVMLALFLGGTSAGGRPARPACARGGGWRADAFCGLFGAPRPGARTAGARQRGDAT